MRLKFLFNGKAITIPSRVLIISAVLLICLVSSVFSTVTITTDDITFTSLDYSMQRKMVVLGDNIHVFYADAPNNIAYHRNSSDNGTTWSDKHRLSSGDDCASGISASNISNNLIAICEDTTSEFIWNSSDGGTTWSNQSGWFGIGTASPQIIGGATKIYRSYTNSSDQSVWFDYDTILASVHNPVQIIPAGATIFSETALEVSPDESFVTIIYSDAAPAFNVSWCNLSNDCMVLSNWTADTIFDDGTEASYPSCVFGDNQRLHCAFLKEDATYFNNQLWYNYIDLPSGTAGAAEIVYNSSNTEAPLNISVYSVSLSLKNSTNMIAVFDKNNNTDSTTRVFAVNRTDAGWSTPYELNSSLKSARRPNMPKINTGGNIPVMYMNGSAIGAGTLHFDFVTLNMATGGGSPSYDECNYTNNAMYPNWHVNGTCVVTGQNYLIDGNLSVFGNLTLNGSVLQMNTTTNASRAINVYSTAKLIVNSSTLNITDTNAQWTFRVYNKTQLYVENSTLSGIGVNWTNCFSGAFAGNLYRGIMFGGDILDVRHSTIKNGGVGFSVHSTNASGSAIIYNNTITHQYCQGVFKSSTYDNLSGAAYANSIPLQIVNNTINDIYGTEKTYDVTHSYGLWNFYTNNLLVENNTIYGTTAFGMYFDWGNNINVTGNNVYNTTTDSGYVSPGGVIDYYGAVTFEGDFSNVNVKDNTFTAYSSSTQGFGVQSDSSFTQALLSNFKVYNNNLNRTRFYEVNSDTGAINTHFYNNTISGVWTHNSYRLNFTSNKFVISSPAIKLTDRSYGTKNLYFVSNNVSGMAVGVNVTQEECSGNHFYNNYFSATSVNAWSPVITGSNYWNGSVETAANIIGGASIGGNYWSDYTGVDTNGDGFGETLLPYNGSGKIGEEGDYLPLTNLLNYAPSISVNFPTGTTPANPYYTTDNTTLFNFTVTDADNTTSNCSLYFNGTLKASNASVTNNTVTPFISSETADGIYSVRLNCTDGTSIIESPSPIYIVLDVTPPTASWTSDTPNADYRKGVMPWYNVTASDVTSGLNVTSRQLFEWTSPTPPSSMNYSFTNGNATNFWYQKMALTTNNYTFNAYIFDKAENMAVVGQRWFIYDGSTPTVDGLLVNGTTNVSYSDTSQFNLTVNVTDSTLVSTDVNFTIYYTSNLSSVQNITSTCVNISTGVFPAATIYECNATFNATSYGNYTFNVTAYDMAGGITTTDGSAYLWFEYYDVPNEAPSISVAYPVGCTMVSPCNTNDNTTAINFTVTDAENLTTSCEIFFNGTSKGSNNSVTNNTFTTITAAETAEGVYQVYLNCTDGENMTFWSTPALLIDVTPPVATWTSDTPAIGEYRKQAFVWFNVTSDAGISGHLTPLTVNQFEFAGNPSPPVLNNASFTNFNATASTPGNFWISKGALTTKNYTFNAYIFDAAGNVKVVGQRWFYVDMASPDSTFVSQSPADITSFNVLGAKLNITYNITDSGIGLNESSIRLYYKTNTSTSNTMFYLNGTAYEGYYAEEYNSSNGSLYTFQLFDNEIYPATYNIGAMTMESAAHSSGTLSTTSQYLWSEMLNVSVKQYSFYEFMANNTGTSPLRVYYCNSTFTDGLNPATASSCTQFCSVPANTAYNHTHTANSMHQVCPLAINTTTGLVGSVKVTEKSYFLIRGNTGASAVNYYYAPLVSRANAYRTTNNNGASWSNQAWSLDDHLHQYDGTDTFYYYAYAADNLTNSGSSAERSDLIDLAGLPPSAPSVYLPVEGNYKGIVLINYTASVSPNGYAISYYNITVVNSSFEYVASVQQNNGVNLFFNTWNSNVLTDGMYYVRVNAHDSLGQIGTGYSANFTVDNTNPAINYTSNSQASGWSLDGTFFINVSANDTYLDSVILQWNGVNETFDNNSGGYWWENKTGMGLGVNYTVIAYANDTAGNWNWTEIRWAEADYNAPVITYELPTPNNESKSQAWVYVNTTIVDAESGLNTVLLEWNGTNETMNVSGSNYWQNKTGLANGNYSFRVYANDTAGRLAVAGTRWAYLDTVSPVIDDLRVNDSDFAIFNTYGFMLNASIIEANLNVSRVTYNVTNISNSFAVVGSGSMTCSLFIATTYKCNATYTAPGDGNYTYNVTAYDLAGNSVTYGDNVSDTWFFIDGTAPSVSSTSPANASTGNSVSGAISITFNEWVNGSQLTNTTINFTTSAGVNVSFNITSTNNITYTLTPNSTLSYSTVYNITIPSGVLDNYNNMMTPAYTFYFTTTAAPAPSTPSGGGGGGITMTPTTDINITIQDNKIVINTTSLKDYYLTYHLETLTFKTVTNNTTTTLSADDFKTITQNSITTSYYIKSRVKTDDLKTGAYYLFYEIKDGTGSLIKSGRLDYEILPPSTNWKFIIIIGISGLLLIILIILVINYLSKNRGGL